MITAVAVVRRENTIYPQKTAKNRKDFEVQPLTNQQSKRTTNFDLTALLRT